MCEEDPYPKDDKDINMVFENPCYCSIFVRDFAIILQYILPYISSFASPLFYILIGLPGDAALVLLPIYLHEYIYRESRALLSTLDFPCRKV